MYTVTRQHQWPDGAYVVEVSAGGLDYTNPDALSAKYRGEFEEFSDPREAINVAIEITRAWRQDTRKRISIGVGATHGYTMPFDVTTFKDAQAWARKEWNALEKCPHHSGQRSRGYRLLCKLDPRNFSSGLCEEMRETEVYAELVRKYGNRV